MIRIKTDDGILLDEEDSRIYVMQKIREIFSNISEFNKCSEVKNPSFWGDYYLKKNIKNYSKWVNMVAQIALKKSI